MDGHSFQWLLCNARCADEPGNDTESEYRAFVEVFASKKQTIDVSAHWLVIINPIDLSSYVI